MKIFIFEYVKSLTDNYHSDGGLVVIAKDRDDAKALIKTDPCIKIDKAEWASVEEYRVIGAKPKIYVFPDAGCC
jgi:hypothetical protein